MINFQTLIPVGGADTIKRKIKRSKHASLQSKVCLCFTHTMSMLTMMPPFSLIAPLKSLTNSQAFQTIDNVLDQAFNT